MTADELRSSRREVGILLALTALPVIFTSAGMRSIRASRTIGAMTAGADPAYVPFVLYAIANWVTAALVTSIDGGGASA